MQTDECSLHMCLIVLWSSVMMIVKVMLIADYNASYVCLSCIIGIESYIFVSARFVLLGKEGVVH